MSDARFAAAAFLAASAALSSGAHAAPSVSFKTPLDGQTVSGDLKRERCEVIGTNIRRVIFFVDSARLNLDETAPWQCNLDTRKFSNGAHTLRAVAYDSAGASASAQITLNVQNGAANSAPTVSFTTPSNGQTVSGPLSCEAAATDDKGVAQVTFSLGATLLNTDVSAPWQCGVDTTLFANGTHVLKAVATDAEGATGTAQISINIQNVVAPPNAAPTVSFSSPASGQTVSGSLQCEALATDDKAVAQVQFFLGTTALNTDAAAPWQCSVDTTSFANGTHVLKAIATDGDGATGTAQISVNIQNAAKAAAIATFESLGLYWTPPSDPGAQGCPVRYRAQGAIDWKDALPLWYDARNGECRGSIVHLSPGATYEIDLSVPGQSSGTSLAASTWSESFPIARVVEVASGSGTLAITEGGTPDGYVLYTGPAILDAANSVDYNITINVPYVIVRGLTLKGARRDAIRLLQGARDVVIEDNDISGWGSPSGNVLGGVVQGVDRESAVRAACGTAGPWLERVVIQRNRMHDPRYGANSWDDGHPLGPNAVDFGQCGGNHVIRYNEIYSTDGHYFKDGLGGQQNQSTLGFPAADTDIYGNIVMHAWDDGIEAEGGMRNVRIWGNYIDQTSVGIATTVVHTGPAYIFRNVYNRSRRYARVALDADDRLYFSKSASTLDWGNGRRYVFHNTLLQATQEGLQYGLGAGEGITGLTSQPLTNTVSRNNILHVWKPWWTSIRTEGGSGNDLDYDLHNGNIAAYAGAEPNGIVGVPIYRSGHGWSNWSGGNYQLDPLSPGYDAGARIPNFNDGFTGTAPDIGAHEDGTAPMRFGLR
jgi:hypothetical protein